MVVFLAGRRALMERAVAYAEANPGIESDRAESPRPPPPGVGRDLNIHHQNETRMMLSRAFEFPIKQESCLNFGKFS